MNQQIRGQLQKRDDKTLENPMSKPLVFDRQTVVAIVCVGHMMKRILLPLALVTSMTSCTLTQVMRIQNSTPKQVSLVDCSGTIRKELNPKETWRYPVVRTATSGLSTPLIAFSTQQSRFKYSVRIGEFYYKFPELYTKNMSDWSNRSWLGQIVFLESSDLVIRQNARPLFIYQGKEIELVPEK